jgi:hypothetical protein
LDGAEKSPTTSTCSIGELGNLTTKIITLLEFFNFVSDEVSRLQYREDQVTADAFGNLWVHVNACLQ